MIVIYILISLILFIAIIFIIGLLLPKERVESRSSVFDTSPKKVYEVVTNNEDWQYRKNLLNLEILERNESGEIWEETALNGNIIRFKTREKVPYSFYSFDMECKLFTGYWTSEFKETENGDTLFTATEHICIKNPLIKALSYLFFDIGKLMEAYQKDLYVKITSD